jgi:hypothetical protein
VVLSDSSAVGDQAVDEFELSRFRRQGPITLVQHRLVGFRQRREPTVEDRVAMRCDDAQPPACGAKIFRK